MCKYSDLHSSLLEAIWIKIENWFVWDRWLPSDVSLLVLHWWNVNVPLFLCVKAGTHSPNCWTLEALGETRTTSGTNLFGVLSCIGSFWNRTDRSECKQQQQAEDDNVVSIFMLKLISLTLSINSDCVWAPNIDVVKTEFASYPL